MNTGPQNPIARMTSDPLTILLADDDEDDRMMAAEALDEAQVHNPLVCVEDGVELLDYLFGTGPHEDAPPPLPGLILLDLNMPRVDGREALARIKADDDLRLIPIVILTTSQAEEDVFRTYDLGVNSFITKPIVFAELVSVMSLLGQYWLSSGSQSAA